MNTFLIVVLVIGFVCWLVWARRLPCKSKKPPGQTPEDKADFLKRYPVTRRSIEIVPLKPISPPSDNLSGKPLTDAEGCEAVVAPVQPVPYRHAKPSLDDPEPVCHPSRIYCTDKAKREKPYRMSPQRVKKSAAYKRKINRHNKAKRKR